MKTSLKCNIIDNVNSTVPSSILRAIVCNIAPYHVERETCTENIIQPANMYPRVILRANRSGFSTARKCVANTSIQECRVSRRTIVAFNIANIYYKYPGVPYKITRVHSLAMFLRSVSASEVPGAVAERQRRHIER